MQMILCFTTDVALVVTHQTTAGVRYGRLTAVSRSCLSVRHARVGLGLCGSLGVSFVLRRVMQS